VVVYGNPGGPPSRFFYNPMNDGLSDTENETQRFARMREEREKRGREREIEREMRVVEKELTERPRERPDVEQERKFRQVGRVTQAMKTRLEEAIDMNTEVHVMEFEEGKVLRVRLLERGCVWEGERIRPTRLSLTRRHGAILCVISTKRT
jgi:hypothetical protein